MDAAGVVAGVVLLVVAGVYALGDAVHCWHVRVRVNGDDVMKSRRMGCCRHYCCCCRLMNQLMNCGVDDGAGHCCPNHCH